MMKMTFLAAGVLMVISGSAFADYRLASNGKTINCTGENISVVLSKKRTTIKYTIEGESLGAKRITGTHGDGDTSISYVTEEGTLTLSDQADTYQYKGDDDATSVSCN